jgi:hypothetical protein
MRSPVGVTGEETRLSSGLLQFRTIEVTALEKRQRDFENASLAGFEFKLLAALRCGADRQALIFAERELVFGSDDDPNSAPRAGDA